jgi:beta-fructofuranosidase
LVFQGVSRLDFWLKTGQDCRLQTSMRYLILHALILGSALARGAVGPASTSSDALARATASVDLAIPHAEADPTRPVYHFHAPAQWMNDPNGPIYYQGFYHMFYQLNPYGDTWGHMHWGHARSRDLVHWQHLPIALCPSENSGEEHVFSGCAVLPHRGAPMLFYTSIAQGKPAETHAEQWAAVGDKNMILWQKYAGNPVLTEALHDGTKIYDWRDPFVFQNKGITYIVTGGNLNQRKGGQAVVNLYRAENEQLTHWTYMGVLFTHPNPKVVNIECPNFFKLGEQWVLVVSPHGPVEYFVGDFDANAAKFAPRHTAVLDNGGNYYAPNCMLDHRGRRIMWGWINGFKNGHGWNGCHSLPRVLAVDSDGTLVQKPAPELKKLRADHFRLTDVTLDDRPHELSGLRGDALEIYTEIELLQAASVQLHIRRSGDGTRFVPITFDGTSIECAGVKAPVSLLPGQKTMPLRLFLDKSVLELYANDRTCFTRVVYPNEADLGVALAATGGAARIRSFHAWKMRSIW